MLHLILELILKIVQIVEIKKEGKRMKKEELIDRAKCKNCMYSIMLGNKLHCKEHPLDGKIWVDDNGNESRTYEETNPDGSCASFTDMEEEAKEKMKEAYRNIIDVLKEYLDLKEEYYNLIALWIIGTYFHKRFNSFPFLFFNAIKGSGKTRTVNLIITLAKDGEMLLSPTEAVLFRTKGTLGIDEFEGVTRQGIESLRELINAAYKKGSKVKRMKQKKIDNSIEMVVEEFDVYRPVVMANIWGMESVLGDRCITLILEKSSDISKTNLIEIFREEEQIIETKKLLNWCSLCSYAFSQRTYKEWNNFIKNNYTNYTNNTNNTNYINYTQTFKAINLMGLIGRDLELAFPLCLLAAELGDEILKITTLTLHEIFNEKKAEELIENKDVSLIEFVSQEPEINFKTTRRITEEFRVFVNTNEEWINSKWMGRSLKRMNLIKEKRRTGRGIEIILDIEKAKQKIKMFKPN